MAGNQVRNLCKHTMDVGESSSTSQSNVEDYERPFKKAKYVWQLKGKYHLKTNPSPTTSSINQPASHQLPESSNSSDTDSDSLVSNEPVVQNEEESHINLIQSQINFHKKHETEDVPVTMVRPRNQTQEEYLEQWQASQLAKGYVDNTINSLLELWKIAPLDGDVVDEHDHPEDEHVEDEGILMAIQSHGLQTSIPTIQNHSEEKIVSIGAAGSSQTCADINTFVEPSQNHTLESNDFLSAAVTAAIKKKGLSSYNFG